MAVFTRSGENLRRSSSVASWLKYAPVSTITSPSRVLIAVTLANHRKNMTPSAISSHSPVGASGWRSRTESSPLNSFSEVSLITPIAIQKHHPVRAGMQPRAQAIAGVRIGLGRRNNQLESRPPLPNGENRRKTSDLRVQFADMANLAMVDPIVTAVLIDQSGFDSRRARADHVDRIDVPGKARLGRRDAQALERDAKNARIGFGHSDDVRIDYRVKERRQSETPCVGFDLPLGVGNHRELEPLRLEPLQRFEGAGPHDAPEGGLAMDLLEARSVLENFLVGNPRRPHPSAKELLVSAVNVAFPIAHHEPVDHRAPLVFRILERERIEPAARAAEFPRQQFVVEKGQRSTEVEQKSLHGRRAGFLIRCHLRSILDASSRLRHRSAKNSRSNGRSRTAVVA